MWLGFASSLRRDWQPSRVDRIAIRLTLHATDRRRPVSLFCGAYTDLDRIETGTRPSLGSLQFDDGRSSQLTHNVVKFDSDVMEIRPKGSNSPGVPSGTLSAKPERRLKSGGSQPIASWPGASSTGSRVPSSAGLPGQSGHKTVSVPFDPNVFPLDTSEQENVGKPLHTPLLIALGVLLVSVVAISYFVRISNVVETAPSAVVIQDMLAPPPLSAPREVRSRVLDNQRIEVTWVRSPDTRATYGMLAFRSSARIKTISAESSPATVDGLDVTNRLLCFEVAPMDSVTGNTATADRACAESPIP